MPFWDMWVSKSQDIVFMLRSSWNVRNCWKGHSEWFNGLFDLILHNSMISENEHLLSQSQPSKSQWNPVVQLVSLSLHVFWSPSLRKNSGHHSKPTPAYEAQGGDTAARAGFHTSAGVTHKRYIEFSVTDKAAFRHTKSLNCPAQKCW